MSDKPVFFHDCPECEYLGQYTSWWYHSRGEKDPDKAAPLYDLYYCFGSDSVLARYGVEPHEYACGIADIYHMDKEVFDTMTGETILNTESPLREAYRLAQERDLF